MDPSSHPPHEVVFGTGRAEIGSAVEKALRQAGIPFQTGIQASPSPRMVFTVPQDRLLEAQDVVALCLASGAGRPISAEDRPGAFAAPGTRAAGDRSSGDALRQEDRGPARGGLPDSAQDAGSADMRSGSSAPLAADEDDEDDEDEAEELERERELAADEHWRRASSPPWKTVGACALVVFAHLSLVLSFGGRRPQASRLAELGALVDGRTLSEPWRLVTSLFLHSDPPHVLWNGLLMTVFAVPLVASFGKWTTVSTYLLSGICGALLANAVNPPGTVTIGSSGAVAGLFGAWLIDALRRVWNAPRLARARLRVMGIGLLVLPTLVTPTAPDGGRISVASHVGGALAGMVIGIVLSLRTAATPLEGSPLPSVDAPDRRSQAWPQ